MSNRTKGILCLAAIPVVLALTLVIAWHTDATPSLHVPDNWCDLETVNEDIMFRPATCEAWVIRCPTNGDSCKAWPVEIMPTHEPGPENIDD